MPRTFEHGDFINPGGWRQRAANAEAKAAATAEKINDRMALASQLRSIVEKERLVEVVRRAKDHRVALVTRLQTAISTAARVDDQAYRTGVIAEGRSRLQAQLDGLPAMVNRAEAEIVEAEKALADHLAAEAEPSEPKPVTVPAVPASGRRASR